MKFWKPGTGVYPPTRYRAKPFGAALVLLAILLSTMACNFDLAGIIEFPTRQPTNPSVLLTPRPTLGQATAIIISPPPTSEVSPTLTPTKAPPVMYYTQPADTLANLAARFGVQPKEITSPEPIKPNGLLKPGQLLFIPRDLGQTSPTTHVIPDSEVVYSPTSLGFDTASYVKSANGYLSTYREYLASGMMTGAEVILKVAVDNSFNPRLLLSLLEYQAHWVTGQPGNLAESEYPLGWYDINYRGLYKQLSWAVEQLSIGYYNWRAGQLTEVTFPNQSKLRLAPEVNAGTAALQYLFSKLYDQREWSGVLYSAQGFPAVHERLFGNPWSRAETIEPLFPHDLVQPWLDLPFYFDRVWSLTGGPHAAWAQHSARAALDFAPASDQSGCVTSQEWVLAPAAGRVVRSENGLLVLDLDGDGREQTGWVVLILHLLADKNRPVGTLVAKDEPLGHPSCEAGISTGTHIHLARKYNGEWVLADGPLPFNLSGWIAHNGPKDYEGYLTKNAEVVTASVFGSKETQISRPRPAP